jgi:hypothetical protein
MAIRKMIIPFKNFLKNTVISSTQMNDNLAEIEYTFNELYNSHSERVKNTYSKEEINALKTEQDADLERSIINSYNAMEQLEYNEITDVVLNGVIGIYSDVYATDEQIAEILDDAILKKESFDFGTFLEENKAYKLDGGEF